MLCNNSQYNAACNWIRISELYEHVHTCTFVYIRLYICYIVCTYTCKIEKYT